MKKILKNFSVLLFSLLFCHEVSAIEKPGQEVERISLDTKLGAQVDLNLQFTDTSGQLRSLQEIATPSKPIVLIPAYYTCPRLCGLILNGAVRLFNEMNLKLGAEYQVITVSFNLEDTVARAAEKETEFRNRLTQADADRTAWHFLVGSRENVHALMNQIGFKYFKDKDEFAHSALLVVLSPQGEISQYFTGIDFSAWDTRLALIEASQGKVGSLLDHVLLYCFRYDHNVGKYTWAVFSLLRVGGVLSILGLLSVILWSVLNAKRRRGT